MEFAYDYSRLHRTGEIVVSADFERSGDPDRLRATSRASRWPIASGRSR